MRKSHPYHIVDLSPWPALTAMSLLVPISGGLMYMHHMEFGGYVFLFGLLSLCFCLFGWWKDVIHEALIEMSHNNIVRRGLKMGFSLFILSEIMFFAAFFTSYVMARWTPVDIVHELWSVSAGVWDSSKILSMDPWNLPFMNTIILLLSGTTLTWAHVSLRLKKYHDASFGLKLTICLGLVFTCIQIFEYVHAGFYLKDGVVASNFYMATGFHGVHVIIGTIFLIVTYIRLGNNHFNHDDDGHLCFEFASWYWHFVDVIWILLFVLLYLLGS